MIDINKLQKVLSVVEKPGRYIGSEIYGRDKRFNEHGLNVVFSYPDLYEIGMSNLGLSIIFDLINKKDNYYCDRVFAPWKDFEDELRRLSLPLYGLDSKMPIKEFDVLAFTIQYELTFTNFLNIIELSDIPILTEKRSKDAPIVIIGGPAVYNPAPFLPFADIVYIGEAESEILAILDYINNNKKTLERDELINRLGQFNGVITTLNRSKKTNRVVYSGFANSNSPDKYIIPLIDVVHNKLNIEIMRGCPNKCRFCQAGIVYKPHRERSIDIILDDIEKGLKETGADEVTFTSLSSGDYSSLIELTDLFNQRFKDRQISFSLPSLKIESFNTDILDRLNFIRKSGLTFAIETGNEESQRMINKLADIDKIIDIVSYSIKKGWKSIKLYFMIGLPTLNSEKEIADIKNFIDTIVRCSKSIQINVNIAVFIPKPHTPFQFEDQLAIEEAFNAFHNLSSYYNRSRVKIKYHDPRISCLEGLIARGDEKVGFIILEAFKRGARFDGWDECFNFETYKSILAEKSIDISDVLKGLNKKQIWNNINVGYGDDYLLNEYKKANLKELSPGCNDICDPECGICSDSIMRNTTNIKKNKVPEDLIKIERNNSNIENTFYYYLIEYQKTKLLKFIGHTDIIRYFERLFRRSGIDIAYSKGFNPRPVMQFSPPLSLGIESLSELIHISLKKVYSETDLLKMLNVYSHNDLFIKNIKRTINKNSLFNLARYYTYSVFIADKDLPKINDFINFGLEYSIEKKNGTVLKGDYKDIINVVSVKNNCVNLIYKVVEGKPNISFFLSNMEISSINIIRTGQYSNNNDGSLLSIYDDY